ncbi:hypothetical protein BC937DRAFT_88958 [Endogone sp. FLAS-F59071]|nr:hypothetical protein BC937DRAFT_88958 [Endogone sp. FLAS-F59071]|eukprot:RUS18281.1 hypothetical protein BC937DRAFT_88958 [Endogone sp. FLAS-F59071]
MNTNKGRMGLCRLKNLVVQLHDQYSSFFTVIILDKTPTADNQQKRVQVRAWTDLVDTLNQTVKALRREGVRAQVLDEIPPFLLNRGFLLGMSA